MALNPYLQHSTTGEQSEHQLYESMVIENIQISGQNYIYIPRSISGKFDQLFGEDVLSSFNSYAEIEMYLSDFSGWSGESEMISKFGLEIRNTASFLISRKRYKEVVQPIVPVDRPETLKWRPCEGDLIYAPFSKSLMEIKFVEDDSPNFFQLNKRFVWALRCELVQLNNEKFTTGNKEVDTYFNTNLDRLNYSILMENGSTIKTESGGDLINEAFVVSKPYDDIMGYGDNDVIKKEFLDIMDFDSNNPFVESF